MSLEREQVLADLASFADDETDVVLESNGDVLLVRDGADITCRIAETQSGHQEIIEGGIRMPYRRFFTHRLARLDTMAQRLLQKRPSPPAFVDGRARLDSLGTGTREGHVSILLDAECTDAPPFAARVLFVTADGGHGKTILLREYQARQAARFAQGASSFLFWHVDLQGRQLLRLSEALMGDLADLRISGIWMPSLITLLRMRAIVLAIDGFDELAAEQGSTDALGALALLVQQVHDRGVIVAASRRTFFDTEDYIKRTRMIQRSVGQCEFDQMRLLDWTRNEGLDYLSKAEYDGRRFDAPALTYDQILEQVDGNPKHPMVTRPFLLTHVARGLLRYNLAPKDFIGRMHNPMESVASVVQAFIQREVEQKWKFKDTGDPYLTAEQHIQLLAAIAEEMWSSQRELLHIEVIELLASALLDEWSIGHDRRRQVLEMVRMHVMLTIPPDAAADYRQFEHPEFRNYFLAYYLAGRLRSSLQSDNAQGLGRLLAVAQLPDSVARYAVGLLDAAERGGSLRALLTELVEREWRPTFLQGNIGTLAAFLLGNREVGVPITLDAKVVFSSLVFENAILRNVTVCRASFLHTSFRGVDWDNVLFKDCEFTEAVFDRDATYKSVTLHDCRVNGVRICQNGEETERAYAPARIVELLGTLSISVTFGERSEAIPAAHASGRRRKLVERLLRVFRRTTALTDHILLQRFHGEATYIQDEVIPLMVRHNILTPDIWRGRGTPQRRWVLRRSLEDILRADGDNGDGDLVAFWREVGA